MGSREWQRRNHSTTARDSWLFRFDHIWSPDGRRRFVDLEVAKAGTVPRTRHLVRRTPETAHTRLS